MPLNATQQHVLTLLINVSRTLAFVHEETEAMRLGWDSEGLLAAVESLTQEEIDAIPDLAGLTPQKIVNGVTSATLFKDTITSGHLNNLLVVARYRKK